MPLHRPSSRRVARCVLAAIASLGLAAVAAAQPLTQNQVEDIVRRAIDDANDRGVNATISVVDREGNLLACVRMTDTVSTDGTALTRSVPTTSVVRGGGSSRWMRRSWLPTCELAPRFTRSRRCRGVTCSPILVHFV